MIKIIYLMIGVLLLGFIAENEQKIICHNRAKIVDRISYRICILVIAVCMILFSGLRTSYNDTGTYLYAFNYVISDKLDFNLIQLFKEQYYGFDYWQRLIKHFFKDGQWLLMINGAVAVIIYLRFYVKYSRTLALTLFCYIIIGTYFFSMAAQKQILAMSISLIAIEFLLKKRYIIYYVLILLAYTFHPYILTMLIVPILVDDVWSKKMIIIALLAAALCFVFSQFIAVLLNIADSVGVGKEYSVAELTDHTINPLRVIVDGIPILMSWILRHEINKKANPAIKLGFNMTTITWLLTFASLFGNPIYVYRTGQYFSAFTPIVVPWMLVYCLPQSRYKKIFIIAYIAFYTAIFIYNFCGLDFSYDPFKHTGIMTLFK